MNQMTSLKMAVQIFGNLAAYEVLNTCDSYATTKTRNKAKLKKFNPMDNLNSTKLFHQICALTPRIWDQYVLTCQ